MNNISKEESNTNTKVLHRDSEISSSKSSEYNDDKIHSKEPISEVFGNPFEQHHKNIELKKYDLYLNLTTITPPMFFIEPYSGYNGIFLKSSFISIFGKDT